MIDRLTRNSRPVKKVLTDDHISRIEHRDKGVDMETVTEVLERLRTSGYAHEFVATADGELTCRQCTMRHDPATMAIDETVRFEGESSPDDEAIVLAVRCSCGVGGVYTSGYGPSAATEDIAVLTRLPRPSAG